MHNCNDCKNQVIWAPETNHVYHMMCEAPELEPMLCGNKAMRCQEVRDFRSACGEMAVWFKPKE